MLFMNIKTWWRIFLNWCLSYIIDWFIYTWKHAAMATSDRLCVSSFNSKGTNCKFQTRFVRTKKHSLNFIETLFLFVKWYHWKQYHRSKNNFMCCLIQLLLLMFVTLLSCWHKTHLNQLSRKSIITECVAIYFIQTYMKTHVAIIGHMNHFWIIL